MQLQGPCDRLVLKVYSKAMVCLGQAETGSQRPGWAGVPLPGELAEAPNGLYYYEVRAFRDNGQASAPVRGKLVVLR